MNEQMPLTDWQDYLESSLSSELMGRLQVRVYQEARSTQDIARSFAPHYTLVLADHQTHGRGRLGRAWLSEPGRSVLLSLVWPMRGDPLTHDRASMLTGIAVARSIERMLPNVAVRIKWPNDVMIEQRKAAGILIETVQDTFIIGIGLNVAVSTGVYRDTQRYSASLSEFGSVPDRPYIIEQLVRELRLRLRAKGDALATWRRLASLGQTQTFEHNNERITGEVLDLDPDHGLIVRRDTGEIVRLPAATTSVIR